MLDYASLYRFRQCLHETEGDVDFFWKGRYDYNITYSIAEEK